MSVALVRRQSVMFNPQAWVAGMIDLRPTSRQCTRLGPMRPPGRVPRASRVMHIKRKHDDEIRIWTGAGAGKPLLPLPRVAAALSGLGNENAPLLVPIHGGLEHARVWDQLARQLCDEW